MLQCVAVCVGVCVAVCAAVCVAVCAAVCFAKCVAENERVLLPTFEEKMTIYYNYSTCTRGSVLHCVAVCMHTLTDTRTLVFLPHSTLFEILQCMLIQILPRVAVCCSVLQCVAVCCSVLQYVAVLCSVLQCVAVS